jgi:hypothetical protein
MFKIYFYTPGLMRQGNSHCVELVFCGFVTEQPMSKGHGAIKTSIREGDGWGK